MTNKTKETLAVGTTVVLVLAFLVLALPGIFYLNGHTLKKHTLGEIPASAVSYRTDVCTVTDKEIAAHDSHRLYYVNSNGDGGYLEVSAEEYAEYSVGEKMFYSTYRIPVPYWHMVGDAAAIVLAVVFIIAVLARVRAYFAER